MRSTKSLETILHDAATLEGETFTYDQPQIEKAASAEMASVYEGLGIRILSIIGGFFACGFFLGFIALSGMFQSEAAILVCGVIFLVIAVMMNVLAQSRLLDGASIAILVTALSMIAFGLNFNVAATAIIFIICGLVIFFIVKNHLLQFLSVLLCTGSLIWLASESHSVFLTLFIIFAVATSYTFVSLREAIFITANRMMNTRYTSLRAGLLFSFIGLLILLVQGMRFFPMIGHHWYTWCLVMMPLLVAVYYIAKDLALAERWWYLLPVLTLVVMLPFIHMAAIPGALLILLVSVHTRNRTGFACGVLAFLYFISRYYYDLNQTLLVKSGILFGVGMLLLGGWLLLKKLRTDETV